jgi:mono/diheme cytochrome c family protein
MKLVAAAVTVLLCVALLAGAPASAQAQKSATSAADHTLDGKELFLSQGCNACHAVNKAGIAAKMKTTKAPDLGTVTTKRETQWLIDYVRQQQAGADGKKHPKPFTGSDEQLGALLGWLQEQQKKK